MVRAQKLDQSFVPGKVVGVHVFERPMEEMNKAYQVREECLIAHRSGQLEHQKGTSSKCPPKAVTVEQRKHEGPKMRCK